MPLKRRSPVLVILLILTLCWGLWPPPTDAQIAVIDTAAITQLFYTVSALLEIVGLNVRDLAVISDLTHILEIGTELTILVRQIQGIADMLEARANGWRGLMSRLPCTARERAEWMAEASAWGREGANEALFGLTLLSRATALMGTVQRLVSAIGVLIGGTTSGLQSVAALQSVAVAELQKLQAQLAPFHQSMLGVAMIGHMDMLARRCIAANRYTTWGTFTRY